MAIFNLPCPVIPGLTFLRVMQSIVFGKRDWVWPIQFQIHFPVFEHNWWFPAAAPPGGLQVMRDELNPVCKVGPLLLSLFST